MRADQVMQGVGKRGVLGHDMRLTHELADTDLAAVLAGGLQDIATTHDAHDAVRIIFPDRHAAVGDARVETEHVGHREIGFNRRNNWAGREHLRDRDVIEAHRIGDEVTLRLGDLTFAGRGLGEATDISIRAIHAGLLRGSERVMEFAKHAENLGRTADELE